MQFLGNLQKAGGVVHLACTRYTSSRYCFSTLGYQVQTAPPAPVDKTSTHGILQKLLIVELIWGWRSPRVNSSGAIHVLPTRSAETSVLKAFPINL